jgi:TDG/mug DNA glycosylase family protein
MTEEENKLPDVLSTNLRVVFCGTAAGNRSAEIGAYYAGPGNQFWGTLHRVGLTPRLFTPPEFGSVIEFGIGFTDLAKRKSGMDHVLEKGDFDRESLTQKIVRFKPQILAFTSKNGAKNYLDCKSVEYGPQGHVEETALWVLPSTSGAARRHWDIKWWQLLADTVQD